ncbi:MAG: hypothetical protein FWC34_10155 [Bacteroidetes bacterium]|nr:hypothetical protein [Bacteroidota bacterium]MCL2302149.1 hypothetical protein [Lentimicrobiaceae bacterium]
MNRKIIGLIFLLSALGVSAQTTDSARLDYTAIFKHSMGADVASALKLLPDDTANLSQRDRDFVENFRKRFAFEYDKSDFREKHSSEIDSLLYIFADYWRTSLLNPGKNMDAILWRNVVAYFQRTMQPEDGKRINFANRNHYFRKYISSKNLYSINRIGKTGRLLDLKVWKNQTDTIFTIDLYDEQLQTYVVLMDNFITLGWMEYATLGQRHSGGWAKREGVFCVASVYDLESENFSVNFLSHEGRHYNDYKQFRSPGLRGTDLEYRAKLTQLSLAQTTLFGLLGHFIAFSNKTSADPHQRANYAVISNLSKALFNSDFESDIEQWKTKSVEEINQAAYSALKANTKKLSRWHTRFFRQVQRI